MQPIKHRFYLSPHEAAGPNSPNRVVELIRESESLIWEGKLYKSRELAKIALEMAELQQLPHHICEAHNLLGLYHSKLLNFASALKHFQAGLETIQDLDHDDLRSATLNNLAQVYYSMGEKQLAEKYNREALENNPKNYRVLNNLASILGEEKKFKEAESLFHQALELAIEADNSRSQIISLGNLGETMRMEGDIDASLAYLDRAVALLDTLDDLDIAPTLELQYGETLRSAKRYDESLEKLTHALTMMREQELRQYELVCLEALQKLHADMGNYETAFKYGKEESQLRKDLFNSQLSDSIAQISASFAEEQEELRYQQLIEKSARLSSIGVMAAGITHEINQPLNAISVSANSVLYWNKNNPKILPQLFVEELEQIARGVDRIDEIVRHMRSFWTPSESKKTEMVSLNEAIQNALSLLDRQLFAHGIILSLDLHENDVMIKLNRIDFEQILINLVVNAMHALDDSKNHRKEIKIVTRLNKEIFELEVQDNGIGLPQVEIEKLFDPLFTTRKPEKGTGLGLAIAQQASARMGGRIAASNSDTHESGATFTLFIPLTNEDLHENSTG
ncbi:MAG: tetratricopeptide repeat protein [Candidatus Marinimicrobia bacterium]|nr:tetratricopeptide repeat protein [Candidatus Neomarinimicrobiota bacterium]